MKVLEINKYGELQQTAGQFRIVRNGDGCVSSRGSFKEQKERFDRLGYLIKEIAKYDTGANS